MCWRYEPKYLQRYGLFTFHFSLSPPIVLSPYCLIKNGRWVKACNISLRDSTHLNYLSQNVTFSHLLFGRVSSGRKTISLIRSTHYSPLTIHLLIPIRTFHSKLLLSDTNFASKHLKFLILTYF